jgi:predicted MFS family arabinose efflux permease
MKRKISAKTVYLTLLLYGVGNFLTAVFFTHNVDTALLSTVSIMFFAMTLLLWSEPDK